MDARTLEGVFVPMTGTDSAEILSAIRRDGFPTTPAGLRSWMLSKARASRSPGILAGAARAGVQFVKENPALVRDGLTIGRAILKLRS